MENNELIIRMWKNPKFRTEMKAPANPAGSGDMPTTFVEASHANTYKVCSMNCSDTAVCG